jgi:hypothetical protein
MEKRDMGYARNAMLMLVRRRRNELGHPLPLWEEGRAEGAG